MDAAALEAALKWMRLSALHPLALVRGPRGDLAKSGAVWRAVTITHAFSTNSNLGAPFMSQQPSIEPATESLPHRRRSRRLSRAERESARDRVNVAAAEALYSGGLTGGEGRSVPLPCEAVHMLIGNRARLWRACSERTCRRARACTAPHDVCLVEPQRSDERKRRRAAYLRFVRDQRALDAEEASRPERLREYEKASAIGARELRSLRLELRAATDENSKVR
jgi:hypothetical protein